MLIMYCIVALFLSGIFADFNSTLSYVVQVKSQSSWGIGSAQYINNNYGKSGSIIGVETALSGVCPCLAYGIQAWTPGTTIPYNYSDLDVKKVTENQQKARTAYQQSCTIVPQTSGQTIDMAAVFESAQAFVNNIDSIVANVLNVFPDVTVGQGYASQSFLKFSTTPVSLIDRINTINKQLLSWARFESYFENNQFKLSLDLQEFVPSKTAVDQGNAFASALIVHYCTLLKTVSTTGSAPVTNKTLIAKGMAVKNALLW